MDEIKGGATPVKSKRNSSNPLIKASENSSSIKEEEQGFSLLKQWEKMQNFTNMLSTKTTHVDEWMKALHLLSSATQDKNMLKEVISSLAKLNNAQQAPKKADTPTEKSGSTPSLSGDTLYDLLNSPALGNIVKEVMKKKK
jgi:hypothetical protein